MAFSLNRAQLIGNVTRDPEVRIAGGQKVATFGIATNFSWKDQSGQRKEKAEFHNVVAWRRLAEICEQYLRRGTKLYIEGRIQTRDWEGEDGVKRYKTEIVVENMIMLDKKGEMAAGASSEGTSSFSDSVSAEPGLSRPAGGIKIDTPKAAQEEEVAIDDLPF